MHNNNSYFNYYDQISSQSSFGSSSVQNSINSPLQSITSWSISDQNTQMNYGLGEDIYNINMLAKVVFAEGANEYSISGVMEGLGYSVRNRVETRGFPDTYQEVIYQTYKYKVNGVTNYDYQYNSVGGKLWRLSENPSSLTGSNANAYLKALSVAADVYYGTINDPTGGALYFHSFSDQNHNGFFRKALDKGTIEPTNPSRFGSFWFFK